MLRSLYSGISGLRNHQVAMDVTANNIANVNTTGFKSGRVTFEESMSQLLKGSSRPPGNAGGTNPMQVGLGMSVGSIDTIITQGNLQATGQITDLAIEGRAYFCYSSGAGRYYSRNGALQMDSTGRLVAPTNGFGLQGITADPDGTYSPGAPVGDIEVPYGEKAPANATTEVGYSSNLDSDSQALGTVIHTNRYLAVTTGAPLAPGTADLLTELFDQDGNSLGIREGDVLTFSTIDAAAATPTTVTSTFSVGPTSTIQDLADAMTTWVQSGAITGGGGVQVGVGATGSLELDMSAVPLNACIMDNLTISSNRPGSNSFVRDVFNWGAAAASPGPGGVATPYPSNGELRSPAAVTDLLADLYDASGQTMGLEDGDVIGITGAVGGSTVNPAGSITYDSATTTMQDILDEIQSTFNLPDTDGTYANDPSVEINYSSGDDRIPIGAIVIRGQPETAFALSNVAISATNSNNNATAPTRFVSNSIITEIQQARDTGVHATSITVYDESGAPHVMTTTFTHSGTPGEWLWEITLNGGEQIIGGNMGRIYFGQDGSPSAWSFDDGTTSFRFNPMNGSNEVSITLDTGGPGSFSGITQFRSPTTTAAREQDGYPMGKLSEISIDEFGDIQGIFTNGVSKSLARILVAEFNNPAGLMKTSDSMYQESNNSGEGVLLQAGVGTASKIKPGALEMSNVELATEFTSMMTTQRGYQANARVISTSDEMLQELVQLIR